MKRTQILGRLGFSVPAQKTKRVIIVSDVKNEADDHFAIMHHLLTPSHDVRGIVACHFEFFARMVTEMQRSGKLEAFTKQMNLGGEAGIAEKLAERGATMQRSYDEGELLLRLAEIDDVPLFKGSRYELASRDDRPESAGADFIIAEAMKEDDMPLYVCLLGSITDLAVAYLKQPQIANRLTAIWIGGAAYPAGGREFNLMQDIEAANVLFESAMPFWQVPSNVYSTMEFSFAELVSKVKPCGAIGDYLCRQMLDFHQKMAASPGDFPNAEAWSIGDNPTVSVLLQSKGRCCWHTEQAPHINEDCSYSPRPNSREIRVYDSVDTRLTLDDLFAKLQLCYPGGKGV